MVGCSGWLIFPLQENRSKHFLFLPLSSFFLYFRVLYLSLRKSIFIVDMVAANGDTVFAVDFLLLLSLLLLLLLLLLLFLLLLLLLFLLLLHLNINHIVNKPDGYIASIVLLSQFSHVLFC